MTPPPLRVALLGSRGIPGSYGGYETLLEELGVRLAARGWDVTVYGRSHTTPRGLREHRGVRLVVLPTLRSKHLDTPVHTALSLLDARGRGFDAALVVNSANAVWLPLLSSAGVPIALHVDGIEKRRAKWGPFGRAVYALSERLACALPQELVTDAEVIREHYATRYGAPSTVLTYGVDPRPPRETGVLDRLGLAPRDYFLYVSRFEPENNPHRVVEAFAATRVAGKLVMVGGAPYAGGFIASFRDAAGSRVLFPGPIYGEGYRELLSHAKAYVHATEVGGTHPALVEAMGYGNCLLVNDTPENREVAGDCAIYFRADTPPTLSAALEWVERHPAEAALRRTTAAERAARLFNWETVTDGYERLFRRLVAQR